eukprot:8152849-Lingulodinium_polyedra.AAC.1
MAVLGDAGAPLAHLCKESEVPELQHCPAVTLADQGKALNASDTLGSVTSCKAGRFRIGRS